MHGESMRGEGEQLRGAGLQELRIEVLLGASGKEEKDRTYPRLGEMQRGLRSLWNEGCRRAWLSKGGGCGATRKWCHRWRGAVPC
jgi:hypothetical protein